MLRGGGAGGVPFLRHFFFSVYGSVPLGASDTPVPCGHTVGFRGHCLTFFTLIRKGVWLADAATKKNAELVFCQLRYRVTRARV